MGDKAWRKREATVGDMRKGRKMGIAHSLVSA